jgi:hypothetical protein
MVSPDVYRGVEYPALAPEDFFFSVHVGRLSAHGAIHFSDEAGIYPFCYWFIIHAKNLTKPTNTQKAAKFLRPIDTVVIPKVASIQNTAVGTKVKTKVKAIKPRAFPNLVLAGLV